MSHSDLDTQPQASSPFDAKEVELDARDPIAWLAEQSEYPQVLFRDQRTGAFLAGAGAADLLRMGQPTDAVQVQAAVQARVVGNSDSLPGWVGGVRFAPHRAASAAWEPFGAAWLMLPRTYLRSDGSKTFSGKVTGGHGGLEQAPSLPAESAPGEAAPDYLARVATAVAEIRAGQLDKVVLARTVRRAGRLDVGATLAKLSDLESAGFAYWLALSPDYGFFGVTPEALYRRCGTSVQADALAGTAPRAADGTRDAELARDLQADPKSLSEHAFVRDAIACSLKPLSRALSASATPTVLSLARVHHLHTQVEAELLQAEPVLANLHPTPAVCGTPTGLAEETIARLERVDRGLYSGAVGWWQAGGESVGVALRCAQYAGETTTTFLGAGIVEGSAPEAEEAELAQKESALRECWTTRAAEDLA